MARTVMKPVKTSKYLQMLSDQRPTRAHLTRAALAAGFTNVEVFYLGRTENAVAFITAARDSLREVGANAAADAVNETLKPVLKEMNRARAACRRAGLDGSTGWPEKGERC